MLNTIKGIINSKKDFLEAAEMIFEDALDTDFDDVIVLGGDTTFTENDDLDEFDVTSDDGPETSDDEKKDDDKKSEDDESDDKETNIVDEPIEDEEPKTDEGNVMDAPIEDDIADPVPQEDGETPMPLPGDDNLPEPVSNVTGEPVADDNLLSMELDLGTNTPTDILPVPPANAGEAIADDIMTQHVDSGFGGDNNEPSISKPTADNDIINDIIDEPVTDPLESTNESSIMNEVIDDEFTEAITIADAPAEEAPASTEEPAPATTEPEGDVVPDDPTPEDNTVTAAVKDKVAEAENPTPEVATDPNEAQEELMKKLSKLTKDMEDAKALVMKSIK